MKTKATHLQALEGLGVQALPEEGHPRVAVQHGGATVDVGGAPEVVLRLPPPLLPHADLPDAVPAAHGTRVVAVGLVLTFRPAPTFRQVCKSFEMRHEKGAAMHALQRGRQAMQGSSALLGVQA